MNILVSGSRGFIGSHLIPKLEKMGHKVVGMDIKNDVNEDIIDYANCFIKIRQNIECIIHLAAVTDVQESVNSPLPYFENNVGGLVNLLDIASSMKVKRFIFASSAAADNPQSPYGVTKLCGEHWCDVFKECYGLSTVSLRFFNVYGKGTDKGVIPTWIKAIKKGKMPELYGDGEQTRDFVYIEDVVSSIVSAMDSKACGVYDIGSGDSITLLELCEELLVLMKSDLEIMPRKALVGEVRHSEAGIVPAFRKLNWKPDYSLGKGLREMLR